MCWFQLCDLGPGSLSLFAAPPSVNKDSDNIFLLVLLRGWNEEMCIKCLDLGLAHSNIYISASSYYYGQNLWYYYKKYKPYRQISRTGVDYTYNLAWKIRHCA